MYHCTYDKNLGDDPAISSGAISVFVSYIKPPGGQANNQTGPKFGLRVTLT
jgi:hypothetical protein